MRFGFLERDGTSTADFDNLDCVMSRRRFRHSRHPGMPRCGNDASRNQVNALHEKLRIPPQQKALTEPLPDGPKGWAFNLPYETVLCGLALN
jgi:hypothetical protein